VLKNGRRVLTRAVAAQRHLGAGPCVAIEVVQIRGRWFRFGFAPPFGFWFRSAWRFPRRQEYLRMLEEYRQELDEELAEVSHIAKSYCSEAYFLCASENIQIHGGIGFTWDHDAHLYFKRAKSSELIFGDPAYHRRALARLLGL